MIAFQMPGTWQDGLKKLPWQFVLLDLLAGENEKAVIACRQTALDPEQITKRNACMFFPNFCKRKPRPFVFLLQNIYRDQPACTWR